jgi:hypothetical protein
MAKPGQYQLLPLAMLCQKMLATKRSLTELPNSWRIELSTKIIAKARQYKRLAFVRVI